MSTEPLEPENGIPATISAHSVAPVVLFLVVNRMVGLRGAVLAATVASVAVFIDRRRKGLPLGRLMPFVTAAVLLRGAIGVATNSETVYFGLGIAAKYAGAAVLAGSVLIGRPLAATAAPHAMALTAFITNHDRFRRAMQAITLVAAAYYTLSATFDVWLFQRSSVEGYVVVRFFANWPLGVVALAAGALIAKRQLEQIPGVQSVSELVEARFADKA